MVEVAVNRDRTRTRVRANKNDIGEFMVEYLGDRSMADMPTVSVPEVEQILEPAYQRDDDVWVVYDEASSPIQMPPWLQGHHDHARVWMALETAMQKAGSAAVQRAGNPRVAVTPEKMRVDFSPEDVAEFVDGFRDPEVARRVLRTPLEHGAIMIFDRRQHWIVGGDAHTLENMKKADVWWMLLETHLPAVAENVLEMEREENMRRNPRSPSESSILAVMADGTPRNAGEIAYLAGTGALETTDILADLARQGDVAHTDGTYSLRGRRSNRGGRGRRSNQSCPAGEILIERRGYTREDGTRVAPTDFCIVDPGRPGRRARGTKTGPYSRAKGFEPWIREEGSLGEGFLTEYTRAEQKEALRRAFAHEKRQRGDYGKAYQSTLGKIQALERSTVLRRRYGRELRELREWFVEEYGGPGVMSRNAKRLRNRLLST